ncbi:hypothetical protein C7H19_12295 [Aphanothece hegewaldii CCALA 016]|uniref:Fucosyltransferase C-terminal domain-containing protein n=1 Tax=Aphanothece hegewaldii CCALA 016 TaxID=2107694 RepID=A0A2T1LXA7_9CHRO|nr:glycosyltransferase family 10 [Aphanothece hegewaldii]PSF36743.1 hypothetical protein C7H19_12295 [Aphanothece hegewaldii CCALA 016]
MINVKLTFPFPDWPILRQTPNGSGTWENYQFFVNQEIEECDYWVVFDQLLQKEQTKCSPENIIFITGEPPTIKTYNNNFLKQFATIITCQRNITHPHVIYSQQGHPWFVGKTYDELQSNLSIQKTKLLSIITSDKLFTDGHKKRYEFAMKLKDYFGDAIDLYGRGIKDFNDKWEVLAPYKYSIAIENLVLEDWLTEKLPDCFLAETFPFYYGCPNVGSYFQSNSFQLIDINDFKSSIKLIEEKIFNSSHYSSCQHSLIDSKNRYLANYSFFALIANTINKLSKSKISKSPRQIQINSEDVYLNNFKNKIKDKLKFLIKT